MPSFSAASRSRLMTCHPDLITIFNTVIESRDCTIIEGYRDETTQNEYYRTGKSQLRYPRGNHNLQPSRAVDVMEYFPERPHLRWSNLDGIEYFAAYVLRVADGLMAAERTTHRLRWGADWDGDSIRVDKDPDESFFDGAHYELIPNPDGE